MEAATARKTLAVADLDDEAPDVLAIAMEKFIHFYSNTCIDGINLQKSSLLCFLGQVALASESASVEVQSIEYNGPLRDASVLKSSRLEVFLWWSGRRVASLR